MQQATDWIALWRDLVDMQVNAWQQDRPNPHQVEAKADAWRDRARKYDEGVKRRWAKPDSSRDLVVGLLEAHPGWTAVDIGGGTGAWAVLMAQHARAVTVVEPSAAMREVLQENVAEKDLDNVTVVEGKWPEAQVSAHDLVFCAHALYGMRDFVALARSLEAVSRHLVVLVMRAPLPNALMGQLALRVWGQPYDSPNFQVAYNALLQMGIFPHVHMEDSGLWRPWTNATLEDALAEVKRKLGLPGPSEHDAYLREMLERNLIYQDGEYLWPRGVRSALMYWDVTQGGPSTPQE
jgi:predicted O-methyltransferase YrrM